jgi:hypothetical protein
MFFVSDVASTKEHKHVTDGGSCAGYATACLRSGHTSARSLIANAYTWNCLDTGRARPARHRSATRSEGRARRGTQRAECAPWQRPSKSSCTVSSAWPTVTHCCGQGCVMQLILFQLQPAETFKWDACRPRVLRPAFCRPPLQEPSGQLNVSRPGAFPKLMPTVRVRKEIDRAAPVDLTRFRHWRHLHAGCARKRARVLASGDGPRPFGPRSEA